jgi:hypothetical protein
MVVSAQTNTNALDRVIDQMPTRNQQMATVTLRGGNHCGMSQIYGWRVSSAMFRSFILSQSPEFLTQRKNNVIEFPQRFANAKGGHLWRTEEHTVTQFRFRAHSDALNINYQIFSPEYHDCRGYNRDSAPYYCFRDVKFDVPFSSFSSRPSWAHAPENLAEAEAMTRWANVNLRVRSIDGHPIEGTPLDGNLLEWTSYAD